MARRNAEAAGYLKEGAEDLEDLRAKSVSTTNLAYEALLLAVPLSASPSAQADDTAVRAAYDVLCVKEQGLKPIAPD